MHIGCYYCVVAIECDKNNTNVIHLTLEDEHGEAIYNVNCDRENVPKLFAKIKLVVVE